MVFEKVKTKNIFKSKYLIISSSIQDLLYVTMVASMKEDIIHRIKYGWRK